MRQHNSGVYLGLKTQFRRLIEAAGGLKEAESITRYGKSQLSLFTDPHSDKHAPVDVVADLEAATGQTYVTEALARLHGDTLEPMDGCLREHALTLAEQNGGLSGLIKRVTADTSSAGRRLSLNERRQLQAGIDHQRELLTELERIADAHTVELHDVKAG